jgi:hypothetical protein
MWSENPIQTWILISIIQAFIYTAAVYGIFPDYHINIGL